jgi:K(+)-stimulated pyrophosphate-energized sodium pump
VGVASLLTRKNLSDNPHRELNGATWLSAGLTLVLGLIATFIFFSGEDLSAADFRLGAISPWLGAANGRRGGRFDRLHRRVLHQLRL